MTSNTIRLDFETPSIKHLCSKDKRLAKVISNIGPIEYSPHISSPFSFLVHEIIEQMMSIKAGAAIYRRLESLCQGIVTPESISNLSTNELRSTGTSKAKAEYIRGISDAIITGSLRLSDLDDKSDNDVIKLLTKFRGIGTWTAKMYLIFVLDRQDVLPYEDGAFIQSFRWLYKTEDCSIENVKRKCKKWRPYTSIASRYLYKALDLGLTKKEFHLFKKENL